MAFARPTLSELVDRIQQDLVSRLALAAPILRRAVVYVLARVQAGAAHMLHGHLEYLSRQVFADESDEPYLRRQAALAPGGAMSPTPAAYATGNVTVTGTDGAFIDAEVVLLRADGTEYSTNAEATIAAGTATVPVIASLAGQDGNCDAGTSLGFESPIAGVQATALVATGGLSGGADQEDLESFRARFLERLRLPPHGGSAADYVAWPKEIPGVTRAWCFPLELGAGTVVVRFVRDDDASLIPDAGEVASVQAHLDAVRPVTAAVTVQAPTAVPLDYTIHVLPDTSETRAAIEAELEDLLLRQAAPGGTLLLSQIRVAIGTAEGVVDFTVTVPASDVVHAAGEIPVMGTITWA